MLRCVEWLFEDGMRMQDRDDKNYLALAWIWVLGFTFFRLIYASFFPLAPDEANYWQWSRHLDWGYHDQSPLIAWVVRFSTLFLGHTELAVRLPVIIAMAVAALYLVGIAARWMDDRTAFHTALITQATLGFNAGALLATPDGLQAAAWAGAAYHTARAYEDHDWAQWLTAGIWFGLGLLSKYTMFIFLPAAFCYGLFSPLHRRRLTTIRPYTAALAGLLMFIPVILWNAAHDWNSLRHVADLGGADKTLAIHWNFFGDYLASQAGLLSPLLFVLALMAWIAVIRKDYPAGKWIYPYLAYTSLPVFAGFALLSFHTRVYGNWPGAGFLTITVITAALYGSRPTTAVPETRPGFGRCLYPWALGSAYFLTFLILLQTVLPLLPIPVHLDRTANELGGWKELGLKAYDLRQGMPNPSKTFLFGLEYQPASELAFYTPTHPPTVSINRWSRPNVYDYWLQDEDIRGWDAVGVTYHGRTHLEGLEDIFERADPPVKLDIYRPSPWPSYIVAQDVPVKTFYIYRAYGFKGGMRRLPPPQDDAREWHCSE